MKFSALRAEYLIQNVWRDLGASYQAIDTLQSQAYREKSVNYFEDAAKAPAFSNLMKPWHMNGLQFPTELY